MKNIKYKLIVVFFDNDSINSKDKQFKININNFSQIKFEYIN